MMSIYLVIDLQMSLKQKGVVVAAFGLRLPSVLPQSISHTFPSGITVTHQNPASVSPQQQLSASTSLTYICDDEAANHN